MDVLAPEEMIQLMGKLSRCHVKSDLLDMFMKSLAKCCPVENTIVLNARLSSYVIIANSTTRLKNKCYHMNSDFQSFEDNQVVVVKVGQLDREWQWLANHYGYTEVVCVALSVANCKALIILCPTPETPLTLSYINNVKSVLTVMKHLLSLLQHVDEGDNKPQAEELKLCESFSRLSRFAQLASDWFWETDEHLRFTYLSKDECKNTHSLINFKDKTPWEIRCDREFSHVKKWKLFEHLTCKRRPFHGFQFQVINASGKAIWISISGEADFGANGEFLGYSGIGRDITALRQRELDLKVAKDDAEYASTAKSHFLAMMSHEIRTPMNAVLGATELLDDSRLSPKQSEIVEFLRHNAELLLGVITDTLDFAKIESGTLILNASAINLHKLIKNVVQQFEIEANQKELIFNYTIGKGVPETIEIDGVRLSQILMNLLANAFKYTTEGTITLTVNRSDTELLICIRDTGVGIPKDKISTIFNSFVQLNNKKLTRQQGVGLGLSITKRLLDLMKGRIVCDSDGSSWSSFQVSIPLEVSNVLPETTSPLIQPNPSSKISILVAEDNPANQVVLKAILEKRNFSVIIVENGELAVDAVGKHQFDVVLMDMNMPIMDGVSASKAIIKKYGKLAPPIIALTANASIHDRDNCIEAGMCGVITKPFNTTILVNKINEVMSKELL